MDKNLVKDLVKTTVVMTIYLVLHISIIKSLNVSSYEFLATAIAIFIVFVLSTEKYLLENSIAGLLYVFVFQIFDLYGENTFALIPILIFLAALVFALLSIFFFFLSFTRMGTENVLKAEQNSDEEFDSSEIDEYYNMLVTTFFLMLSCFLIALFGFNVSEVYSTNIGSLIAALLFLVSMKFAPKIGQEVTQRITSESDVD